MMNVGDKNKGEDFYEVLGLHKECTTTELRIAYKKLALRWHPDRCSGGLGNTVILEEAKKKFQTIQQAYSVLSDDNKRFLYDVGVYDSDDDDEENSGMSDFLNEMADMMIQSKSGGNDEESFEDIQELFRETFQADIDAFGSSWPGTSCATTTPYCGESLNVNNKRNSSKMDSDATNLDESFAFDAHFTSFCLGVEDKQDLKKGKGGARGGGKVNNRRQQGRKQKTSSGHNVGISAS